MTDIDAIRLNFSPESLMLLNAILAIVMFSIALDLRPSDFRALVRTPKALLTGMVSQFVVLPALTFAMLLATNPQPSIALGLILVAACPGGNISNFITHRAGGNSALSVSMTGVATLAAIIMTFSTSPSGAISTSRHGRSCGRPRWIRCRLPSPCSSSLLLPLMLGVLLNVRLPDFAARIRKTMQRISMAIFVGFIVLALAANWAFFLSYAGAVAGLVIPHNALALSGGYLSARLAGLSEYDRRAITIETGIQNSGLGLVLIFAFFGGLGGMAVAAAFWGVWHAISGLALAALWSRREARR